MTVWPSGALRAARSRWRERLDRVLQSPRCVWWVLAIGGLVRVGYALRTPLMEWDAHIYAKIARHLVQGAEFSVDGVAPDTYWAPFVPWVVALLYRCGASVLVVRLCWAAIGAAGIVAAYRLGCELRGRYAGNLAAIGFAFYPYNVLVGGSISTEMPNVVLILLLLWFLVRSLREARLRWVGWAAGCLGLSCLNRPAGVALVPVLMLVLVVLPRGRPVLVRVGRSVLLGALVLAILAPWSVRNSRLAGRLTLVTTAGPLNLWHGNNPWLHDYLEGRLTMAQFGERVGVVFDSQRPATEQQAAFVAAVGRFYREQPRAALSLLGYKMLKFWSPPGTVSVATQPGNRWMAFAVVGVAMVTYWPLLICFVVSVLWFACRERVEAGRTIVYLWLAVSFATNIWFAALLRYRFASAMDVLMIVQVAVFLAAWRGATVSDDRVATHG